MSKCWTDGSSANWMLWQPISGDVFLRIAELIEAHGIAAMREPQVKHLEGELWEMRMKGKDGIARAIYVTATAERVVVVHAFIKKTQKTPASALEIARKRAREVTA
jgi:phage-related protein